MQGATRCEGGAPYFTPTNCVARSFTADQAGACLNGSTIFLIGNSVARQMMYELGVTLNGGYSKGKDYRWGANFDAARDRVQQKMACAKAPSANQDSHAQSCEVAYAPITSVKYMWRQWMGQPFAYADTAAEGDFCYEQDYFTCMEAFLAPSRPGDLLVFQLGLAYARYLKEDRTDIPAYMRGEAEAFVSLVHRVWRGGVVLAVDTTPMQPTASGTGWPPGTNTRAALINEAIVPIFQAAGWPVVNQHAINTVNNGSTVLASQYEVSTPLGNHYAAGAFARYFASDPSQSLTLLLHLPRLAPLRAGLPACRTQRTSPPSSPRPAPRRASARPSGSTPCPWCVRWTRAHGHKGKFRQRQPLPP